MSAKSWADMVSCAYKDEGNVRATPVTATFYEESENMRLIYASSDILSIYKGGDIFTLISMLLSSLLFVKLTN